MTVVALVPVIVIVLLFTTDLWVYNDAKRRELDADPVVVSIGGLRIDTPLAWVASCTVFWTVAFPIYRAARKTS